VLLRCEVCSKLEVVHLDEIDVQVLDQNQQIGRYCKWCSAMTSWRKTSNKIKIQELPEQERQTSDEKSRRAKSHEKRRHNRVRTTVSACIRQPGRADEIVACEDLSRGGLSFRTRSRYAERAEIEVAISYSPGAGNIFVPARIVYVKEVKGGFRCGVAYVTAAEKRQGYDGSPCAITRER
jgi:PilZ domain